MLTLDRQEGYRQRYAMRRPGWQPATLAYERRVAARTLPGTRVLDLGCGRGGVMERLHVHAGFVAGLDPDLSSLREHRTSSLALGAGRAERLPYADCLFDVVCCSWVLEHLGDPLAAFREVARVLVPDGHFVFLTPNVHHPLIGLNRALSRLPVRWVERVYGRGVADTFPALYRANSLARIRRLLREAGLVEVALETVEDPTYLAFGELLFRLACMSVRFEPRSMHIHLVGEAMRP